MLTEIAEHHPGAAQKTALTRPLVADAICGNTAELQAGLAAEQEWERHADSRYWEPLKKELEQLRRQKRDC